MCEWEGGLYVCVYTWCSGSGSSSLSCWGIWCSCVFDRHYPRCWHQQSKYTGHHSMPSIYANMWVYILTHIYVRMHISSCEHFYVFMFIYTFIYTRTYMNTCIYMYIHVRTYIHIRTYTNIYIHTRLYTSGVVRVWRKLHGDVIQTPSPRVSPQLVWYMHDRHQQTDAAGRTHAHTH